MEAGTFTYSGGTAASQKRLASLLIGALEELREVTNRPDLQAQTAVTFLAFAAAGEPLTVLELMSRVGYERSSASRNIDILAEGIAGKGPGVELLQKAVDPFDARKRVVKLSKKGELAMRRIENRVAPTLQALVRAELREQSKEIEDGNLSS